MPDKLVHLRSDRGVASITLDSPHNRNALSAQLRAELRDRLTEAIDDDRNRVILLEHTGPVFCSGMDLKEARSAAADDQGVRELPAILQQIWHSPKPVVAKLAGPARAGGLGLVVAADIAVASDTVTFAINEVRLGLVPAVISVLALRRVPARAAQELFLTGETFDAHRAKDIGLINSAVPAAELDTEITRYTQMLNQGGPSALAATKDILLRARQPMDEEFGHMLALSAEHFAGAEGQEGMRAFAAKRNPEWAHGND